jgi:hypothetical protein
MSTLLEKFASIKCYLVYRELYKSVITPEGMLFPYFTTTIEPDDILQRPLTKAQSMAYLGIGTRAFNELVKTGILKQRHMSGYNGHVFLRNDVRRLLSQAN